MALVGFVLFYVSCAVKPNDTELLRLEEARKASEAAENHLKELKAERAILEKALLDKQKEIETREKSGTPQ